MANTAVTIEEKHALLYYGKLSFDVKTALMPGSVTQTETWLANVGMMSTYITNIDTLPEARPRYDQIIGWLEAIIWAAAPVPVWFVFYTVDPQYNPPS